MVCLAASKHLVITKRFLTGIFPYPFKTKYSYLTFILFQLEVMELVLVASREIKASQHQNY